VKVGIDAIEYFLPKNTETGEDLVKENPDWRIEDIEKKTGVKTRYIASEGQTATDLAVLACEKLLDGAIDRKQIDFLIYITQSPEYALPTSACILQDRLGLKTACMAFDVNLGCSGFVYGLAVGGSLVESRVGEAGLVVCSETYSKYIDKNDRACRPLFSDGAAATLISGRETNHVGPFDIGSDGSGYKDLIVSGSGARGLEKNDHSMTVAMDGAKVFMFTMGMVPQCVNNLLAAEDLSIKSIDLFIFHQASQLVIENIIRRLELPEQKVYTNYHRVGNTVSASIPIALKDAAAEGVLQDGDQVMLVGFGVGYSWAGCIVKWDSAG
jgi:3-oxoacyl-[acyl-carrier-protein] synthase III